MSDTPLSKLLNQGSSLTSYNIGQVAKLEAQIAALTAALERVTAERDAFGRAIDALNGQVLKAEATRDAALKDQARYRGLRAIIAAQRFVPVEQVDEETDAAIAAREGVK